MSSRRFAATAVGWSVAAGFAYWCGVQIVELCKLSPVFANSVAVAGVTFVSFYSWLAARAFWQFA